MNGEASTLVSGMMDQPTLTGISAALLAHPQVQEIEEYVSYVPLAAVFLRLVVYFNVELDFCADILAREAILNTKYERNLNRSGDV